MNEQRQEGIKQYEELRKKHKDLPKLEELEEEFEGRLQAPIVAGLMMLISERMSQCAGHIEVLYQPTRMSDMIECKFHNETEKKELFEFYKKIISLLHELSKSAFENRDERIKKIIKCLEFYKQEMKPTMKKYLEKQAKGWLEQEKPEPKNQYFG